MQIQPADSRLLVSFDKVVRYQNSLSQLEALLRSINTILLENQTLFFDTLVALDNLEAVRIYILTDKKIANAINNYLLTLPQVTRKANSKNDFMEEPRFVFLIGPSTSPSLVIHLTCKQPTLTKN